MVATASPTALDVGRYGARQPSSKEILSKVAMLSWTWTLELVDGSLEAEIGCENSDSVPPSLSTEISTFTRSNSQTTEVGTGCTHGESKEERKKDQLTGLG